MTACTHHYIEPAANYSIEDPEPEPVKADAGAASMMGFYSVLPQKEFFSIIS